MATAKPPAEGGASIACPSCGTMVKLPAEHCPSCGTNLRTGERPEKETSVWQRRGFKPLVVTLLVVLPLGGWLVASGTLEEMRIIERARVGLSRCADPPPRLWEEGSMAEERQAARKGYGAWRDRHRSRPQGMPPNGPLGEAERRLPKEERARLADRRNYFASSLMSDRPAASLSSSDDWYGQFAGEWDAAWTSAAGTPDARMIQGEWNFSWINGGEALQDLLSLPYLWEAAKAGSIRATTVRTFNKQSGAWEGVRVQGGRVFPFSASRNRDGNIYESFNDGSLIVTWIYYNVTPEGFQVTVNETADGGRNYRLTAEIWAKRRTVEGN
jgi:hypothetical protein